MAKEIEELKKQISIAEERLRRLEESQPQQRTSKEQLDELWGFKINLDTLTHEQLKHALIASGREEKYEYIRYSKERIKCLKLELQLKEMLKLSQGIAQLSSDDVLIEAVRKFLQDSKRKAIDKRRVCKEIIHDFVDANNLALPDELKEILKHLEDLREGEMVTLQNNGQPSPPAKQEPLEEESEVSQEERIREAILKMREEGSLIYNYYYVYVMQVINETESIKLHFDYTTSFLDYLSRIGIDKLPPSNALAKQLCKIKGAFPNWSFKGVKDSQKASDRINVAKRFLSLYNKIR